MLRKGSVKGAFLSPFLYSPSPLPSPSPFPTLSLPLAPAPRRLVALKVYDGVQGAGGMKGEAEGRNGEKGMEIILKAEG